MTAQMKTLLWKDYRLSRLCLLAGVIFIISPYLMLFLPYVYPSSIEVNFFKAAWTGSTMVSQLAMAFIAGNIIACERTDRSAAFLAYQGSSRKMVVTSKLLICTIAFTSICAISFVLSFWLKIKPYEYQDFRLAQISSAAIGFCFFGCCWLLSALLTSSVAAIVLGFLPPFFIGIALSITAHFLHWPSNNSYSYWHLALITAAGLLSLVAGTWHFIRSKES